MPFDERPVPASKSPNPLFEISRDMTFRAAYADVKASVVRLSRSLVDSDLENSVAATAIIISMMVIAIKSSISEKPD
jgi:hypothetical protein